MECYEFALKNYNPKRGDIFYILKVPLKLGQLSPDGHSATLVYNKYVFEHIPGVKTIYGMPAAKWKRQDLFGHNVGFFDAFRQASKEEIDELKRKCMRID